MTKLSAGHAWTYVPAEVARLRKCYPQYLNALTRDGKQVSTQFGDQLNCAEASLDLAGRQTGYDGMINCAEAALEHLRRAKRYLRGKLHKIQTRRVYIRAYRRRGGGEWWNFTRVLPETQARRLEEALVPRLNGASKQFQWHARSLHGDLVAA